MKNRCARVAGPTRTSMSPVANGSSVPACPTFPPRSRRTRATTSWEVGPAALSARRTPGGGGCGLAAGGELGTKRGDQLRIGQVGRKPRGPPVASAAVAARDRAHVDVLAGRSQADLPRRSAGVGAIPDNGGEARPLERADVVDDALGQHLLRAGRLVVGGPDV